MPQAQPFLVKKVGVSDLGVSQLFCSLFCVGCCIKCCHLLRNHSRLSLQTAPPPSLRFPASLLMFLAAGGSRAPQRPSLRRGSQPAAACSPDGISGFLDFAVCANKEPQILLDSDDIIRGPTRHSYPPRVTQVKLPAERCYVPSHPLTYIERVCLRSYAWEDD